MKDRIIVYGELVACHDLSVANNYESEICLNVLDPHGKLFIIHRVHIRGVLNYAQNNIFTKNRTTE